VSSKLFYSLTLVFTAIAFVYVCVIGIENIFRYNDFKTRLAIATTSLEKEKLKAKTLNETTVESRSPLFWEELARTQLGFTKPDEVVYKFFVKNGSAQETKPDPILQVFNTAATHNSGKKESE